MPTKPQKQTLTIRIKRSIIYMGKDNNNEIFRIEKVVETIRLL